LLDSQRRNIAINRALDISPGTSSRHADDHVMPQGLVMHNAPRWLPLVPDRNRYGALRLEPEVNLKESP